MADTARAAVLRPPADTRTVTVARRPGQAGGLSLIAVDARGRVLAADRDAGPTGLPMLRLPEGTDRVFAGAEQPTGRGPGFRVYANDAGERGDARDADGDGLGRALEAALGTCDAPGDPPCAKSPLRSYYRRTPGATADTDRDGLDDGDELIGVADPALDLPGWGADPLHKDVFVEVDYRARMDGHGLSEADVEAIAALYARGTAAALRNPDGKSGLRLHVDVGFAPSKPENAGLLGDWGGSGPARGRAHYSDTRKKHFARDGYFRYALAKDRGTGTSQVGGDAFQFNRHFHRVLTFAHELGHTLGVQHWGHSRLGPANCKPHYQSIMNYAYQKRSEVGFYVGESWTLNPAYVLETDLGALDVEQLRLPPYELDATDEGIDWNRDGRISRQPVRAAITWATHKGCAAMGQGRRTLLEGAPASDGTAALDAAAAVTPRLWSVDDEVHALFVSEDGRLHSMRGTGVAPDPSGHCTLTVGGRPRRVRARGIGGCVAFEPARAVEGAPAASGLAVAGPRSTALAVTTPRGRLWVGHLERNGEGLRAVDGRAIPGARTTRPPALVSGPTGAVRAMWMQPDGALKTAVRSASATRWIVAPVHDAEGTPISVGVGPGLVTLPGGELCGLFPDPDHFLRLFCSPREQALSADARFEDLSRHAFYAGLGPRTEGEASIAFQPYLSAHGHALADDRGALHVAFTEPSSQREPHNPAVLISEWLDGRHPPADRIHFRWRGTLINEWTNLAAGTTLELLSFGDARGLAGLAVMDPRAEGRHQLVWLPAVDGAFDLALSVTDDFEVMERNVCLGLRDAKRCGGRRTAEF